MTQGYIPPPPPGVNLTTTDQFSVVNGIKMLVYGKSGVGKTRLSATAPKAEVKDGGHAIIISAEGGLLSLRGVSIPVWEIKTLDDLNKAHDYLIGAGGAQYWTIIIDSISDIAEKVLANAKAGTKDGRQAYGILADQMWETIRSFRDIKGKHVVMIAKAEFSKDQNGVTRWMPSMPGNRLTQGLAYYFDIVGHLGTYSGAGGQFSAIQFHADLTYEAKDRSGSLDFYEYPSLENIFNKIYGVA